MSLSSNRNEFMSKFGRFWTSFLRMIVARSWTRLAPGMNLSCPLRPDKFSFPTVAAYICQIFAKFVQEGAVCTGSILLRIPVGLTRPPLLFEVS